MLRVLAQSKLAYLTEVVQCSKHVSLPSDLLGQRISLATNTGILVSVFCVIIEQYCDLKGKFCMHRRNGDSVVSERKSFSSLI